jgi:putative ABC transport system permease protein
MFSNLRHAWRQLLKNPGFTSIALGTLAVGIGVTTTSFTVLNSLLFRPSPYPDAGRLVSILRTAARDPNRVMPQTPGDFMDEREQNTVFEHIAAFSVNPMGSLLVPGQIADRSTAVSVSAEYFQVMGITPAVGRTFTPDDEARHAQVIVLSNASWKKRFGGDPQALGQTLRFDGLPETVIGVMPATLDDPTLLGASVDIWKLDDLQVNRNHRDKGWYHVVGRLKPGASLAQAQAEMTAIGSRLALEYPKTNSGHGLNADLYHPVFESSLGQTIAWLVMDLSGVVLLIACANLGNLQLARNTGRAREFAIRRSIGCSRGGLIRMLLAESLLLSLAGGALGLLFANWASSYVAASMGIVISPNFRVILFAFSVSALTAVIFGTFPAWVASRADLNEAFRVGSHSATGDRSRHRVRRGLIVVELAITLLLLTGAGYFIGGLRTLTHKTQGWSTDNVIFGTFSLSHDHYGEEGDERSRVFGDRFRSDLLALPGVDQAIISRSFPMTLGNFGTGFLIEGRAAPIKGQEPLASPNWVTPGFFATYGMRVEQGRDFTEADRPGSEHVAIINRSMAEKFWPRENPLGKRLGGTEPGAPNWCEVVGVVNDISGLGESTSPQTQFEIYRPWAQSSMRYIAFAVHSAHDPRPLESSVRRVLSNIEPDVAITTLGTIDEYMKSMLSSLETVSHSLVEISLLGLMLSFVGVFGVIANLTSERTREIGIRMALGADASDVLWLFLRSGMRVALIGMGIGLLASCGLMVVLTKVMGVFPGNDPRVAIAVTFLLVGVSLLASWLPARRATQVDPVVALRAE